MAEITDDKFKTISEKPKKAVIDGVVIEQHDLDELIKAKRFLDSQNAVSNGNCGFIRKKMKPAGTA